MALEIQKTMTIPEANDQSTGKNKMSTHVWCSKHVSIIRKNSIFKIKNEHHI